VPKGFSTKFYRSTDSTVVVALEGTPSVEIEGQVPVTLAPNDVFAVPGWSSWRITSATSDAVLFAFSDRPVHEKLGLFREERN
jgi:gentisate 1,2-dioxygenase